MKKVVISCGPIPARLDSVKFLTNRFKGGLAFKTAEALAMDKNLEVTVVKWIYTALPWDTWDLDNSGIMEIVNIIDVAEYAKWFENHAKDYDAFIMAAAVANLMPSNPYETKFPSHLYKVGDTFDIQFEIAPRAIDIIKKINPRCCLIGYKLFDAATDDELIDIARHTLKDAKANIIFANTPKEAKSRKIAVMADGAAIPMDFDTHITFMKKAIYAEYFKTIESGISPVSLKITQAEAIVKYFETTFPDFGTIAVRVPQGMIKSGCMVTTSRGHKKGPVVVTDVDFKNRTVKTESGKATLNAPLLWKVLEENPDADYVIHRHFDDPMAEKYKTMDLYEVDYQFPGTMDEVSSYKYVTGDIAIKDHGYVVPLTFKDVDWGRYYDMFPGKYFGTREIMDKLLTMAENHPELMSMEVGGNTTCRCRYNLDPNMKGSNAISYDDLEDMKFDIIVARNSINYLSADELNRVMASLKDNGVFMANSFAMAPDIAVRNESHEVAVKGSGLINHFLMDGDDIYTHSFYARGLEDYKKMGFDVMKNGRSIIISKGDISPYMEK